MKILFCILILTSHWLIAEENKSSGPSRVFLSKADFKGKIETDAVYHGAILDSSKEVGYQGEGRLLRGYLKEDHSTGRGLFKAGTEIAFFPDGAIQGGTLKERLTIDGIDYDKDTQISFHFNGKVSGGYIEPNQEIFNILIEAERSLIVYFNERGFPLKIEGGHLVNDYKVGGMFLIGRTLLDPDEKNGVVNIIDGKISKPYVIASIMTDGHPNKKAKTLIAPKGASFTFSNTLHQKKHFWERGETWGIPGNFEFNGVSYGWNSKVIIKEGALALVHNGEKVFFNGEEANAGMKIPIDHRGFPIIGSAYK